MQKNYTAVFISLVTCTFIFLLPLTTAPVFAVAASQSASEPSSPSATPEETTMQLKKRIEKVVEEKREQIKGVITNLLSEKHGFIGEVSRLSQEAITVKQNGDSRIIPFTEELVIIKKGKRIKPEEIEVGNWVTIIGTGSSDTFTPEFIIVSSESLRPRDRVVGIGSLTAVGKSSIKLMKRGSTENKEYLVTKTSKLENVDGSALKLTEFEEDLSVLLVATKNTKDEWEVVRLRALTDLKSKN
jgi:hypothetical protein